jgi:2-dehydropantoate 2-reductase
MHPIRNVLVCGVGAVGSTYLERLHDLDPSLVGAIASGERRARLASEGVTVNGRLLPVRTVGPGDSGPPADVILVAVKHHHLPAAIEDMRPFVGGDTVVLSLLNGITSEDVLGAAFGRGRVLHGFVVGNDVLREGSASRYSSIGRLVFGAAGGTPDDPRVRSLKALMDRAGIPTTVPADIIREQWWKFMLNVGVNQVSAVLRAPMGAFSTVPEVTELTRAASLEVVAVAQAEGIALAPTDVEAIFPIIAALAPYGKSSMLQDVEAGRKTEVEIFAGEVCARGRRRGVATPVNDVLGMILRGMERLPRQA